jgi:hypothetical protein
VLDEEADDVLVHALARQVQRRVQTVVHAVGVSLVLQERSEGRAVSHPYGVEDGVGAGHVGGVQVRCYVVADVVGVDDVLDCCCVSAFACFNEGIVGWKGSVLALLQNTDGTDRSGNHFLLFSTLLFLPVDVKCKIHSMPRLNIQYSDLHNFVDLLDQLPTEDQVSNVYPSSTSN